MEKIKIELTVEELQLVITSLANMPYKDVAPLISGIIQQSNSSVSEESETKPKLKEVN